MTDENRLNKTKRIFYMTIDFIPQDFTDESAAFRAYCEELNKKCAEAQSKEKETVSEESAFIATVINRSLAPETAGDFLLIAAALNTLNTYVKQDNNKKTYGYYFKRNAEILAEKLAAANIPEIRLDLQESWGLPFLLADIAGIQCSFHQVPVTGKIAEFGEKHKAYGGNLFEFDGIRKQMCANTLLDGALGNPYLRTDKTIEGANLKDDIDTFLGLYREGKVTLSEIRFLHEHGKETSKEFIEKLGLDPAS